MVWMWDVCGCANYVPARTYADSGVSVQVLLICLCVQCLHAHLWMINDCWEIRRVQESSWGTEKLVPYISLEKAVQLPIFRYFSCKKKKKNRLAN